MENLKALLKGMEMTPCQRALATREFVAMERRLNELEQQFKNCNLQNVSVSLSSYTDWLWLNHNILTNAEHNQIALEKYLATL